MKQIIKEQPPIAEIVTIREMFRSYSSHESVIAYITQQGTGLAVSTQLDNGYYGFYYHKDLIKPYSLSRHAPKYIADTKTESLQKVLDAGRKLLIFDNFKEFVEFTADHTKL